MRANEFLAEAPRHDKKAAQLAKTRTKNVPKITKAVQTIMGRRIDDLISNAQANNKTLDKGEITQVVQQTLRKSTNVELDNEAFGTTVQQLMNTIQSAPEEVAASERVTAQIADVITKAFTVDTEDSASGLMIKLQSFLAKHQNKFDTGNPRQDATVRSQLIIKFLTDNGYNLKDAQAKAKEIVAADAARDAEKGSGRPAMPKEFKADVFQLGDDDRSKAVNMSGYWSQWGIISNTRGMEEMEFVNDITDEDEIEAMDIATNGQTPVPTHFKRIQRGIYRTRVSNVEN